MKSGEKNSTTLTLEVRTRLVRIDTINNGHHILNMNKWTSAAIREFRMSLQLTQEELGVLIGVTTVHVNHLEQGMRKPSIPLCILLNLMKKEIENSGK